MRTKAVIPLSSPAIPYMSITWSLPISKCMFFVSLTYDSTRIYIPVVTKLTHTPAVCILLANNYENLATDTFCLAPTHLKLARKHYETRIIELRELIIEEENRFK